MELSSDVQVAKLETILREEKRKREKLQSVSISRSVMPKMLMCVCVWLLCNIRNIWHIRSTVLRCFVKSKNSTLNFDTCQICNFFFCALGSGA